MLKILKKQVKRLKKNSILKVKSISNDYLALADDSGLCVKDLNQEPGIFSARYANSSGGWFKAMEKIYERVKVKKKPTFSAKFVCSLSLKFQDEKKYLLILVKSRKDYVAPKG